MPLTEEKDAIFLLSFLPELLYRLPSQASFGLVLQFPLHFSQGVIWSPIKLNCYIPRYLLSLILNGRICHLPAIPLYKFSNVQIIYRIYILC